MLGLLLGGLAAQSGKPHVCGVNWGQYWVVQRLTGIDLILQGRSRAGDKLFVGVMLRDPDLSKTGVSSAPVSASISELEALAGMRLFHS